MNKKIALLLIAIIASKSLSYAAEAPEILEISAEESCGSFNGVRLSIDIDSKNQPHVVVDSGHEGLGSTLMMYNKIGGGWRGSVFATRTSEGFSPSAISQPWVEIDANDRMWVFAQYFRAGDMSNSGQGVWLYGNMTSSPTKSWFHKKQVGSHGWGPGNISIDPRYPDEAVVMTINGTWAKINSAGTTTETGTMGPNLSGEKFRFRIAPYSDGSKRGVWHGVMNGSSARHSAYRNSLLSGDQTWASHSPYYPSQGDDHNHAGVCGDLENPEIGYMAAVFEDGGSHNGLQFNIWDGSRMLYPTSQLGILDSHATFIHRYAPALTPAFGGGCWAAWGNEDGEIWIAYINSKGIVIGKKHIASGFTCAINTDKNGNIHIAYVNGGIKYRKLNISGASSSLSPTKAGDYNGDGRDDLATYNPDTGRWYILDGFDTSRALAFGYQWGFPGSVPVVGNFINSYLGDNRDDMTVYDARKGDWYIRSGIAGEYIKASWGYSGALPVAEDYSGNGMDDLAVYDASSGAWNVMGMDGSIIISSEQWGGFSSAIPVPGDYDNDGKADLAIYDSATGKWYIRTSQRWLMWDVRLGTPSMTPVLGDYNGDGVDELAMYDEAQGLWYIKESQGNAPPLLWAEGWGGPGMTPVSGDYDGDGKDDLALYVQSSGKWYIKSAIHNGDTIVWDEAWGGPGMSPVSGDYDGDGKDDFALYAEASGKWYIKSLDGTIIAWAEDWGGPGMSPVSGDYDGDGKDDFALYAKSGGLWYIKSPDGDIITWAEGWGGFGLTPVSGDYNGDGINDLALCYEASGAWFIKEVDGDIITYNSNNGQSGIPFGGDYDGNGTDDLTIINKSTSGWYSRTKSKMLVWGEQWGGPGMIPVAGDFDGNGADMAVWDKKSGNWYVRSILGTIISWETQLGFSGMHPISGDFDGDNKNDLTVWDPIYWQGWGDVGPSWYSVKPDGAAVLWNIAWGSSEHLPIGSQIP